jgi:hypothetical protein
MRSSRARFSPVSSSLPGKPVIVMKPTPEAACSTARSAASRSGEAGPNKALMSIAGMPSLMISLL